MTTPRTIDTSAEFDISAAALWQLVSDFARIDRWSDLKVLAIEGSGIGCRRSVEMGNGVRVTERLVESDAALMTLVYEAVAPNPFPMRDYRSNMRIESLAPQRCRLHWSGSYVPLDGNDPARTDRLLDKVYTGGIELLHRYFAAGASK